MLVENTEEELSDTDVDEETVSLYVKLCCEAVSKDVGVEAAFSNEFQGYVEQGDYSPDLIFSVNEIGLYWKTNPVREERSASGFKAARDRLTLLLGANVSGTLTLKAMLMHQTPP